MGRLFACLLLTAQLGLPVFALERMKERVAPCAACHGEQGRSREESYAPSIAGKPLQYLFNQLRHFRDGRRGHAVMRGLLENLSDDYLQHMAEYFSAQSPKSFGRERLSDPASHALGQKLAARGDPEREIPACNRCHGEHLSGQMPAIPGLVGLSAQYISAQMGAWRTGGRSTGDLDCMQQIASRMSTDQITAVSGWLASQAVSPSGRPEPKPKSAQALPIACFPTPKETDGIELSGTDDELTRRGQYLLRAGNCMGCHSNRGELSWAGGRAIETPFGDVFSSNLTPDPKTGLGSWTANDFWQALHHGVSKNGRLLYPAFPYTHYSLITREDSDAMWAYLKTLQPVSRQATPHSPQFPFNTQVALRVWRWLYFDPLQFESDPQKSQQWNRGRYLVEGLGHCSACHGERNSLGAIRGDRSFAGSLLPSERWYAPPLQIPKHADEKTDLIDLLKHGTSKRGVTSGPMAEVVAESLQYLTDDDLEAMLDYLSSLSPVAPTHVSSLQVPETLRKRQMLDGEDLYESHCASCHGKAGRGEAFVYPPLVDNDLVLTDSSRNAIRVVKYGGYAPSTKGHPFPFGMPPFVHTLSADEIATVLTYIRNSWGNKASAVSPVEVAR